MFRILPQLLIRLLLILTIFQLITCCIYTVVFFEKIPHNCYYICCFYQTFADDTVALSVHNSPVSASSKLQDYLDTLPEWLKDWRIMANESKSVHETFTLKHETFPAITLNSQPIPQFEEAIYLGIHLDKRLTWITHIFTKSKALGIKLRSLWLFIPNSKLENKKNSYT